MHALHLILVLILLGLCPTCAVGFEEKTGESEKSSQEDLPVPQKAPSFWKPARMAEVSVARMKPRPLVHKDGWTWIPDFLDGGTIYSVATQKTRTLDVTAESDGGILVAASWTSDENDQGRWRKTRRHYADFYRKDWIRVGQLIYGENDRHYVFFKHLKKGDKLHFHTRADLPPYVVFPNEEGLKHIAEATDTNAIHHVDQVEFADDAPEYGSANHRAVMINMHYPRTKAIRVIRAMLPREFVRQAILMTAREELQLGTRDSMLRERFPADALKANRPLEVYATIQPRFNLHVTLFHRIDGKSVVVWDKTFPMASPKQRSLESVTTKVEELSRTEFVAALKQAGFDGVPNQTNETADVPPSTAELLKELSFVPQFQAIRQLHELIRAEGGSPRLYQALARGYAHLGLLTGRDFSINNKVFLARAWLYAERALAADPNSPVAHWTRAYVRVLSGRYNTAQEAIVKAEELAKETNDSQLPEWADIIKAVTEYDEAQLAAIVDHLTHPTLARLLRLVGPMRGNGGLQTREAARVLELTPDCYFAVGTMMQASQDWKVKRQLAKLSQQLVGTYLYDRLAAIPDLPEEAKAVVAKYQDRDDVALDNTQARRAEHQDRAKLIQSLHAAGSVDRDDGELSWGVLGQLIQELSFRHAYEYLEREQFHAGETVDDAIDRLLPLVADHPYQSFLETFSDDQDRAFEAQQKLADALPMGEMQYRTHVLYDQAYHGGRMDVYRKSCSKANVQTDPTFDDMLAAYEAVKGASRNRWVQGVERVAPNQPMSIILALLLDWRRLENRFDELETKYAGSVDVQGVLGRRLSKLGRFEAAERCLKRRFKLASAAQTKVYNARVYIALADIYKQQGKEDLWLGTLLECLEETESSRAHTRVRIMLARHFMEQKNWETAWPYAEAAAQYGNTLGLICAKDCAEGQQEWDTAEEYAQQLSGRNKGRSAYWHLWCKRFDRGDEEAAREAALESMHAIEEPTSTQWFQSFAAFHLSNGDDEEAIDPLYQALRGPPNPFYGLHLALAAQSCQQPELRDETLQRVIEKGKTFRYNGRLRSEMIELAELFRQAYATDDIPTLDLEKVDALLKRTPDDERTNLDYFVGRFLELNGDEETSTKYLLRCARSKVFKTNRALASALLHARGVDFLNDDEADDN